MTAARHPGLDAARAAAMVLVVVVHASISYMETPVGWAVQDGSRHLGVDVMVWIVRCFVMPLFFWLSGYFARSLYQRTGGVGFVRQRLVRLALPLAVALVPCSLALDALWDRGRALSARADVAAGVPALEASELPLTLGHLWFLYYLLILSALALAIVPLWRLVRPPAPLAAAAVVALLVGPLLATGSLQLDTPLGFVPDPAVLAFEAGCFAWGWLAHAAPGELERYARHARHAVAVAALAFAAVVPALLDSAEPAHSGGAPPWAILASATCAVALVAAVLGFAVAIARRAHPLVRLVSDASYWIYVVHLPLVVWLQLAFARRAWPGPIELPLIVAATMVAGFVSYALLVYARRGLAASLPRGDRRGRARPGGTR